MIEGGLLTRATHKKDTFFELRERRLAEKKKKLADDPSYNEKLDHALKLVINSLYGVMGNEHSTAYDPCLRSSICRVGQLMLVVHQI